MTTNDRIAEIIKKFCKEDCIMTQRELAKAMDVTPACVNKWIREGSISLDKIPQLCNVIGVTPNYLFGFETQENTKALELYKAFQRYPEYHSSIYKLLNFVLEDIELQKED